MFYFIAVLSLKISPLYINIALGYLASKKLSVAKETIAPLIVYIIAPVVVFSAAFRVKLDKDIILIPIIIFAMAAGLCFLTLFAAKNVWRDRTKNLAAFSSGTGNTGYFGIPLAFILLPQSVANIYVLAVVMSFLYEYTIGFYVISRGSYTFAQSMIKIIKLPVIYAAAAGFACNILNVDFINNFADYLDSFRGAYSTLGMMMIGMGLVGIKEIGVDVKFICVTFFAKFIVWPLGALLVIFADKNFFHLLSEEAYSVIFVYSIVPMAANTAIMATLFKVKPEQASFAILLSTIFAFFTIPLMAALFL
ncbi:MAG: AEC family transporter [Campylobacteraceae bacterium]|jgi:predicted permease|nr:AEC family transporter [Campylobacteraceae bacterium]